MSHQRAPSVAMLVDSCIRFAANDSLPLLFSLLRECQQDPDWDDDFTVGDLVKRYVPCQKAWDTG